MKKIRMVCKFLVFGIFLISTLALPMSAQSAIIGDFGLRFFVKADGPIELRLLGGVSAGFTNELYLDSPFASGVIFNNMTDPRNTIWNSDTDGGLPDFEAGDELIFKLKVNTGPSTFYNLFSYPDSSNPDGAPHTLVGECQTDADCNTINALIAALGFDATSFQRTDETLVVGFEDIQPHPSPPVFPPLPGEPDWNDLSFAAINITTVPVPGAFWLLGCGLIGLVGLRRKFRK